MYRPLKKADFILAMGCADDRVAVQAATLYKQHYSSLIVTSGGFGKITKELYNIPEAERFCTIINNNNVPKSDIIVENKAANTGDNIVFARKVLQDSNITVQSGILVTKPYLMRRAYATAKKQWPEIEWQVSAPDLAFDNYFNDHLPFDMVVNLMVGDLQRVKRYAEVGFQIPQIIPEDVWQSYLSLKEFGFTKYTVEE